MIKEKIEQIFTLADEAQVLYKEKISKEHSEFMIVFIDAARNGSDNLENIKKPFQDKLITAADQRDAYNHMISIIQVQKLLLDMDSKKLEECADVLFKQSFDDNSLTGIPKTLESTNNLLNEVVKMLSSSNDLTETEQKIANRMQAGCCDLIDVVLQIQGICKGLKKTKQLVSKPKSFR